MMLTPAFCAATSISWMNTPIFFGSIIVFSRLHSEPTTRGEVAPVRIKKMKKTNKAVVRNPPSLASSSFSLVWSSVFVG